MTQLAARLETAVRQLAQLSAGEQDEIAELLFTLLENRGYARPADGAASSKAPKGSARRRAIWLDEEMAAVMKHPAAHSHRS